MTGLPPKFGAADLSNCDKEPIHVPGSIQPHGVLLALDPHTLKVRQVAGDAKGLFGVSLEELLSHGLESRLGPEALEQLKLLAGRGIGYPRPVFAIETRLEHDGHYLDAVVHTTDCELVVEFEPSPQDFRENPLPLLQSMIASVQEAPT